MKSIPLILVFVPLGLACLPAGPVRAQQPGPPAEADSGAVVCAPGAYLFEPDDCLPLGPSVYLTELARLGLTLPARPLPARRPDPALSYLPYSYFRLGDEPVPLFSGIPTDPKAGYSSIFPRGFSYISYLDRVDTGHGIFYLLSSGGWIPAGPGSYRVSEIPSFQGLEFQATPRNSFGWTFEDIPIQSAPGYHAPQTRKRLLPFTVVQIYSTQNVDGADWNLIGLDQWVEARKVAQIAMNLSGDDERARAEAQRLRAGAAVFGHRGGGDRHRPRAVLDTTRPVPDLPAQGDGADAQFRPV